MHRFSLQATSNSGWHLRMWWSLSSNSYREEEVLFFLNDLAPLICKDRGHSFTQERKLRKTPTLTSGEFNVIEMTMGLFMSALAVASYRNSPSQRAVQNSAFPWLMAVNKDLFPTISRCSFRIPHKHFYSIYFSIFLEIFCDCKKIILKVKRGREIPIEERCVTQDHMTDTYIH